MNKILTILFLFVFLTSFGQVKDTIYSGETFIVNLGDSLSWVDAVSSNTVATSEYGGTIVDEVFYVPSTAPNDTIYTLMGNRTVGKTAAILFERGSSRDTTIVVSSDSLVFGAYGTGAKPKIYGSEVITGWTLHSGNIWKATVTDEVTQVFINDERIQNARYPKDGYAYIDIVNSTTSVTCDSLDAGIDYAGAKMHTRTVQWRLITNTVVSSSSKTLTVDVAPSYGYAEDKAFFLNNHLDFLTAPGEWYFDSGTNTLYVWTPNSDSPANYIVRGSVHQNNINLENRSYITLKDLNLLHSNLSAIEANNGPGEASNNIIINNVDIFSANGHGIRMLRTTDSEVKNSAIDGCIGHGIFFDNEGISFAGNLKIENNIITNIARFEDITPTGSLTDVNEAIGIFTRADNVTIKYNRLENIGYTGIYPYGQNSLVQYNYVKDICRTLNDGAGIYVWRGNNGTTPYTDRTSGTIIEYNIVDNSNKIGDDGYSRTSTNTTATYLYYADETTTGVIFRNNIAINGTGSAYYTNQPKSVTFQNNIAFNNSRGFRYNNNSTFSEDNYFIDNIVNSIKETSDWSGTSPLPAQMVVSHTGGAITLDNNIYVDRHRTNVFRRLDNSSFIDFTAWKTFIGDDANSEFIGTALSANETETIVYNDSRIAKTFYLNNATNVVNNVTNESITTSFVLQPFTSILIKGVNVDCILDYEDSVAPVITEFALINTSNVMIVTPETLTSTGNTTSYLLTESNIEPNLYDEGWSLTPSYAFDSNGAKTLYVWARDEAGNISSSMSDNVVIDVPYPVAVEDIIHVWKFNETSGTNVADEISANDGTATGTTILDGKLNKARYFNGVDDYVTINMPSVINSGMTSDFSLVTWIKMEASTAYKRIIEMSANSTNGFSLATNWAGRLNAQIKKSGTGYMKANATTVDTNDYMMVVVTWDTSENTTTLYINDNVENSSGEELVISNSGARFGGRADGSSFTNVTIDETIIINRILTTEEISDLFNAGSGLEYFE